MSQNDPDSWMWERARELLEKADKLHRRFFQLSHPRSSRSTWEPPIDIFESPDALWIIVALPGVDAGRVEITLDGCVVTIRGERGMPAFASGAVVRRLEIPHGGFERSVELPPGRYEAEHRELCDGCLHLSLKKL